MTRHTASIICPACVKLPEWQWTLFGDADDFCEQHAGRRYPAVPITNEEWEEAERIQHENMSQLPYDCDYFWPVYLCLPDSLRRCRACAHEWVGAPDEYHLCPISMDGESVYGPYTPNQADEWEDDMFALPTRQGAHRRY